MQCETSPCAGYSGCNTIQDHTKRRDCLKNNCFCDIGPEKSGSSTSTIATEPPMCIVCGKYNACETNKSLVQRQDCLSKNCGPNCKNFMDTFPPLPVEPFVYFPRTIIR